MTLQDIVHVFVTSLIRVFPSEGRTITVVTSPLQFSSRVLYNIVLSMRTINLTCCTTRRCDFSRHTSYVASMLKPSRDPSRQTQIKRDLARLDKFKLRSAMEGGDIHI
jgi:hypothetical protein